MCDFNLVFFRSTVAEYEYEICRHMLSKEHLSVYYTKRGDVVAAIRNGGHLSGYDDDDGGDGGITATADGEGEVSPRGTSRL
jgi:hypothetical protein